MDLKSLSITSDAIPRNNYEEPDDELFSETRKSSNKDVVPFILDSLKHGIRVHKYIFKAFISEIAEDTVRCSVFMFNCLIQAKHH